MKITTKKTAEDKFHIEVGHAMMTLSRLELMRLALSIDDVLFPVSESERARVEIQGLRLMLNRLNLTDKQGIRAILREIPIKHLQIVTKLAEGNQELLEKIYGNLSKRAQTVLREDVSQRFQVPVSVQEIQNAVESVLELAQQLQDDGQLQFDEPDGGNIKI